MGNPPESEGLRNKHDFRKAWSATPSGLPFALKVLNRSLAEIE